MVKNSYFLVHTGKIWTSQNLYIMTI